MALPNFKFHQDVVTSMCYSTYAGSAVTIDHENIVKCLDLYEDELYFYLVSGHYRWVYAHLIAR